MSSSGSPGGMFGGWQLPQFQPPAHYAPSQAQQNATQFLNTPPPQQPQQQIPMPGAGNPSAGLMSSLMNQGQAPTPPVSAAAGTGTSGYQGPSALTTSGNYPTMQATPDPGLIARLLQMFGGH